MKKTRLCRLLSIEYPIIQAPMAWITCSELVAAVSDAGGLGTLGPEVGVRTQEEAQNVNKEEVRLREQMNSFLSFIGMEYNTRRLLVNSEEV